MKVGSSVNHDKITASQFMFAIVCYVESFALLTAFSLTVTHQDTWIAFLLGMVGALPMIFINLYLIKQYPNQNLIQINRVVYGKPVGSLISVLYCWYFLTLCSLNLRDTGDFLRMSVMSETPSIFIKIPFLVLCSYAVLKGLKIIVRYSTVFAYIGFFALILTTILVSRRMNYHNLFPVLTTSPVKLLQCINMVMTIPFGTSIFLMIAPAVQDQKKVKKSFLTGFFVGALVILIVVIRDIVVLGKISEELVLPSYETMCLSGVTETFQRLDILYVILLVILEYFKISLLFYATSVAISQLLSLKSYKPLVLVIGALILVYSFIIFPSSIVHLAVTQTTIPVLWLLFEYIFPFVTFLCTKLRARKEVPAIKS
jgi:spore germination protein KB